MRIVAIAGANIRHMPQGKSVELAQRLSSLIQQRRNDATGEVIALVDKEIEPCIGCGGCIGQDRCMVDDDFTGVYQSLKDAEGLVIVSPHYAPIPAKLCALLERIESIAFLNWWRDENHRSALAGKPVALIGHGGAAGEQMHRFYRDVVLAPLKNALEFPVNARVVTLPDWPHIGVVCGPTEVRRGERFPIQLYDDALIEERLSGLADALVSEIIAMSPRPRTV